MANELKKQTKGPKKQKQQNNKMLRQEEKISDLKESLVYYKEITETIREPFLILDGELRVVSANPAFYRKFKVPKKSTEGKLMYELDESQWDTPELRNFLEKILPENKKLNDYEITLDFSDLGRKTMLLNARQIDHKQLIFLAFRDVTAEKKMEANAEKITKDLTKQRDKLRGLNDAKDEFISLASHQLRTPATIVKQYVNLLSDGYAGELPQGQEDMLTIVSDSNERQLEIIEDLLRVARVDAGKVYLSKTSRDLSKEVEAAIDSLSGIFKGRGQKVSFDKPKEQMMALVDPKLMFMVLENILDNASKYSPKNTTVTVKIEQNQSDIVIAIKDKGVGIRKKDQTKLFKKFSRVHNSLSDSVKGTGLGLYWAKKIIDLHGGNIEIDSTQRGGSTFTIKVPAGDHAA